MTNNASQLGARARQAMGMGNWPLVQQYIDELLKLDPNSDEGHFLQGMARLAKGAPASAAISLAQALQLNDKRHDAAVELARIQASTRKFSEAVALINQAIPHMQNSPHYLNMAGETLVRLGLHEPALPLFRRANEVQPGIARVKANLASTAARMGELETARTIYADLLAQNPAHQRNHYELARMQRAEDDVHIRQMQSALARSGQDDARNIFLLFALAKELEDIGQYEKSFEYLHRGNAAAAIQSERAGYDVANDIALLDGVRDIFNTSWFDADISSHDNRSNPVLVVGLPRTGTTLVERILGSHSKIESIDETFQLEQAVKTAAGMQMQQEMTRGGLARAAQQDSTGIWADYLAHTAFKRAGAPVFVEKYPFNYLYLGFVMRANPKARLVFLDRKPMDACFAMFKQPYFRFSYRLDWLARYYLAYDALRKHWQDVLGDRLIAVRYEELVSDPDTQIRQLLKRLDFAFEPACLDFHLSRGASTTASFAQVREKPHTRSVNKWQQFAEQLAPLRDMLTKAGVDTTPFV